jgi:ubiquinone/menaquinone biosynthesis C-methylase UbiE
MSIKNLILLDAGCGNGRIAHELAIQGANSIVAIDLSKYVLKKAKKMLNGYKAISNFIECDIEQLPIRSGSFDAITCIDTLVHIPHPSETLDELVRVIKQDGSIAVNITNKNPLWRITGKGQKSFRNFFTDIFLYHFPSRFVKSILQILNKKMIGRHMTEAEFKRHLKVKLKIEKFLTYGHSTPISFMAITKKQKMKLI